MTLVVAPLPPDPPEPAGPRMALFEPELIEAAADLFPRAAGYNAGMGEFNSSGSTETILPGNSGDVTRTQAKLSSFPTGSSKITATYLFNRSQFENHSRGFLLHQFYSAGAART